MIYIIISDITSVSDSKCSFLVSSFPFLENLSKATKNKQTRLQRMGAYLTLKGAYEKIFEREMPDIIRDENGKPRFVPYSFRDNSPLIPFSISHTDTLAAVAFADCETTSIGVDIERKSCIKKIRKISDRFLKNVNYDLLNQINEPVMIAFITLLDNGNIGELNAVPMLLSIDDNGDKSPGRVEFSLTELDISQTKELNYYTRWTLTESALKADGRGFGAISEINTAFSHSRSVSYWIHSPRDEFSLSLTIVNK